MPRRPHQVPANEARPAQTAESAGSGLSINYRPVPSDRLRYTDSMRFLAILLILTIASVGSADDLFCPDGCAETPFDSANSPVHGGSVNASGCVFCHGGWSLEKNLVAAAPGLLARESRRLILSEPASAPPSRIDHPPRHA